MRRQIHLKGCKKTDIMRICHVGVSKKISIFSLLGPALMKISLHRENNLHFWQVHAQRVVWIKFHFELLFLLQHSLSNNRVKRTSFSFSPQDMPLTLIPEQKKNSCACVVIWNLKVSNWKNKTYSELVGVKAVLELNLARTWAQI